AHRLRRRTPHRSRPRAAVSYSRCGRARCPSPRPGAPFPPRSLPRQDRDPSSHPRPRPAPRGESPRRVPSTSPNSPRPDRAGPTGASVPCAGRSRKSRPGESRRDTRPRLPRDRPRAAREPAIGRRNRRRRSPAPSRLTPQPFVVRVNHHAYQLLEGYGRRPLQLPLRERGIGLQQVHLGGTEEAGIFYHVVLPIQPQVAEGDLHELTDAVGGAAAFHVSAGLRAPPHSPHCLDVIPSETPVATRIEISEPQLLRET